MTEQPATPLLDTVATPARLRELDKSQLKQLADELREEMIAAAQAIENGSEVVSDMTPALSVSRAIVASLQCLSDLDSNVRPRLALEAMVVAWPNSELRDR